MKSLRIGSRPYVHGFRSAPGWMQCAFLATVLLLTALSQRFEMLGPRITVVGVACALLVISTYLILTFPRV
jgi:hypothetical protein